MDFLAHSAKGDQVPQTYAQHVEGVRRRAVQYANEVESFAPGCCPQLSVAAERSAIWHDLGKLDDQNQDVLQGRSKKQLSLPINHVDAGSALLLARRSYSSALAVYSHHIGLPNSAAEERKGQMFLRDEHFSTRNHVDRTLCVMVGRHETIVQTDENRPEESYEGYKAVFYRMLLSCLADADHSDTAAFYGHMPEHEELPRLRAHERLEALDRYVSNLGSGDERSVLRREMYFECRDAEITDSFVVCDSPVGSGKTTAVMAHLLRQAELRGARRVIVVLPYTSIIQQSVDVYRNALVLPGEEPEKVVAELHYRADYQDSDTRYLTSLWRSPIIVTTAVAFFETLASNRPASLRRLHELPGSVLFIDESHNALPIKLLPLAWLWMNVLADEWGCYWVLASGSLVRFWELDPLQKFNIPKPDVSSLVGESLRTQLMEYEENRITFCWMPKPVGREELTEWVLGYPGPRLLIMNTVQSAAVIADEICQKHGRDKVEHISTALTPEDRENTIKCIRKRLKDGTDNDWTLVATSCVEAGVDFSFRTGFRELSSLLSLLQAAGRVNRHGLYTDAEIWSFSMQDDSMLKQNPVLATSREVLRNYFDHNVAVTPELSTRSLSDELIRDDSCMSAIRCLLNAEKHMQFVAVDKGFSVIESNTVLAVVDDALAREIANGKGDWRQLQRKSVSVRRERIDSWSLLEIARDVYRWTLRYDPFLGYMSGVLDSERTKFDPVVL